ncbi:MAG TPA: DUF4097 family beta strand repeat-containing protein [Gemmatimonadales bacterium]|nr:DUF4097 family beta strand repeat-containing protein [Gemmatimonadales bacterium]
MTTTTPKAAAFLAALALGAAPLAAQADFHWSGKLAAGQRIEIKGVNGSIHARAASGATTEVTAHKSSRRSDPESVEIRVVPFSGGVTICAVYPTPRRAREENDCESGGHWHSDTDNNDVEVDFDVQVGTGVDFDGQTVNGEVGATGLTGNVSTRTVNGGIDVSTSGHAEATTVNGSIRAAMGKADWPDGAEFTTVNGGITLQLPAGLAANVRASTLNGDIESDFPLTVTGKFGPRRVNATIGGGGRELSMTTVNGDIRLEKNP